MALRAVPAPESTSKALASSPMTVAQAAENGSERELLVAMRRRIATAVDDPDTAARDLASLTKRLNEVVRDIKAYDAVKGQEAGENGPTADEEWTAI